MAENAPENDDAPDWSLLPRDPAGFFALDEGFDRKDLKRSYNRLLRRYKPEKHPEEFQRVRSAFEELERRLRYGETTTAAPVVWDAPAEPAPPSGSTVIDAPARIAGETVEESGAVDLESLAAQLESGEATVEALYKRIKGRPNKTPPDYYALALLADAASDPDELLFLCWLLKGITAWPGEPALSRLMYEFLRNQTPLKRLPQVLIAVSEAAPGDAFFQLTEGAWDRLLREGSFELFAKTLAKCEKRLAAANDPAISGRVAFYIHALRFAVWKDPTDWKERALAFVEENFDQAPPHLENDFDALGVVREYLAHRAEFVAENPLRQRMDRVLEMAFTEDQYEADLAMLECQRLILESPREVARAFPAEASEAGHAFYALWNWITQDTASRFAPPDEHEPDWRLWRERVLDLLHRLKHQSSTLKTTWDIAGLLYGFATPVCIGIVVIFGFIFLFAALMVLGEQFLGTAGLEGVYFLLNLLLCTVVFVSVGYYMYKKLPVFLSNRLWGPFCNRMAKRCYRKLWRPEAFSFLRRSQLDYFAFRAIVSEQAQEHQDERTWMDIFIQQDYGLAIYSLAQGFQA